MLFKIKPAMEPKTQRLSHLKLIIQRNSVPHAEIVSELNLKKKKRQALKFFPLSVYI